MSKQTSDIKWEPAHPIGTRCKYRVVTPIGKKWITAGFCWKANDTYWTKLEDDELNRGPYGSMDEAKGLILQWLDSKRKESE